MTITELKAAAFDAIQQVGIWQERINELGKMIKQAEAEAAKAEAKGPVNQNKDTFIDKK